MMVKLPRFTDGVSRRSCRGCRRDGGSTGTGTTPASFSTVSVAVWNSNVSSSISTVLDQKTTSQHHHQQLLSPARVGNYLPITQGHLNLLASFFGAPPQSSGGKDDDNR